MAKICKRKLPSSVLSDLEWPRRRDPVSTEGAPLCFDKKEEVFSFDVSCKKYNLYITVIRLFDI